ncbi:mannitol 1-phosphate dehydrogenase [Hypoxylon sp. FL1150]|nr:mannitol 1-phosphate dehydrogenase [Hypoxylon sp. FL1150]
MERPLQTPPTIAILGAGIGGLALAIGLIKRNIPVTVYEAAEQFSPVGAGIGLGPNALNAMDIVDPRFRERYEMIATRNETPEFENVIFDALYAEEDFGQRRGWSRGLIGAPYFARSSAHRKDLLEIMVGFIPEGTVKFKKRASMVEQFGDKVCIRFEDGTAETVSALVGADGVKGITRQIVLGEVAPDEVQPTFSGMCIYRGIIPIGKAREILGTHAGDAKFFMSKGRAAIVYPISQGREENFVFFVEEPNPWLHGDIAKPCTQEDMKKDLEGFDGRLLKLLDYARLLKWPVWHHPKTSTFFQGHLCLLGDVAHASTPFQAAGAGQGLEDAAILSHLLSLVKAPDDLELAFRAYDFIRRPRAQKVVLTSFEAGLFWTFRGPPGDDMNKIVENANQRLHWIWQHNLGADIRTAEDHFFRLASEQPSALQK